jgi:hypothetical protein
MKRQIHKIATVTITLAIITALSSCKSEEEKRREARQRSLGLMAIPEFNQRVQQQQAQRERNEAVIDATGRAVGVAGEPGGKALPRWGEVKLSGGGSNRCGSLCWFLVCGQ